MLHTGFVGSGQTLKLRIWAWGHFMLEHVPNLGDFMDRDERSVVAKILDEKVALQPLDDGKERKWTVRAIHRHVAVCSRLIVLPSTFGICAQSSLHQAFETGRNIGYKSIMLGEEHQVAFANVVEGNDRGHPVQRAGMDVPARINVGPDFLRRLHAVVSANPLVRMLQHQRRPFAGQAQQPTPGAQVGMLQVGMMGSAPRTSTMGLWGPVLAQGSVGASPAQILWRTPRPGGSSTLAGTLPLPPPLPCQ